MKHLRYITIIIFNLAFTTPIAAQSDSTATIKVYGACGMCKQRIEKALKVNGVSNAKWDLATKLLTVTWNPATLSLDDIHTKMAAVGHDTELKKAKDAVYKALPECCLYRDMPAEELTDHTGHNDGTQLYGIVLSEDNKGNFIPLAGAAATWLSAKKGAITNIHGVFSIPFRQDDKLVVSYAGYRSDTITVEKAADLQVVLAANNQLNEVSVRSRPRPVTINTTSVFRTYNISSRELLKAACCNLSESFETNPSVDVSYNDAVTGSKQIQLLGLSGNYTQLTVENLPGPRGLATPLGLNSIAGPWIESIQLSKGTGSVVNGFESIAGQINIELKKPENSEQLYANGYVNSMGKTDLNLNLSRKLGSKWATTLLLHDNFLYNKVDFNNDMFRDLPTGNLFSAVSRWKFDDGKGLMLQFGAKALTDDRVGGEMNFAKSHKGTTHMYGVGINTSRYEGFAKIGYVFPAKKFRSIGLQLSAFRHDQDSYFGLTDYKAAQDNFYSNLIFQDIIGTTDHKYRTGLSFSADNYNEQYNAQPYRRKEIVPGAFFEYTYTANEKFSLVGGLRADHNSIFGWFVTPRLNARYEPVKGTTIRLSAGRGQRTANIFAENMGLMVSARTLSLQGSGSAYGFEPEIAWNKGLSVDQKFRLFEREAMLSVDFFRNDFIKQVVVDLEDPRQVKFYQLEGKSYSNSLQTELNFTPAKNFDVRLAYRWFDVKTSSAGQLLQKPFMAAHRGFTNLAYEINGWKFDYTFNYTGNKRIPSTAANPAAYQLPSRSPGYVTINAQVSKSLGKNKAFEFYLGGENLTNYFQDVTIVAADQPFSPHFDATMIWGPVSGRLVYGGFRYRIK